MADHEHSKEGPVHHQRRLKRHVHLHPCQFPVFPVGILQRNDRRDGQALPGRAGVEQGAIGLGAVRPLSRLLPDVDPRGMAGEQARL